jgi:hypothetical protein
MQCLVNASPFTGIDLPNALYQLKGKGLQGGVAARRRARRRTRPYFKRPGTQSRLGVMPCES